MASSNRSNRVEVPEAKAAKDRRMIRKQEEQMK